VLLSGVRGEGFVLCFGADGHVAVEAAEDGRCHGCAHEQVAPAAGASLSRFAETATTCGTCVDVVLHGDEARSASTPRTGTWIPNTGCASVVTLAWGSYPSQHAYAACGRRAADSPAGPLALLRTVILRT
jgi:hypothetical protein